jgi:hypothetical protein
VIRADAMPPTKRMIDLPLSANRRAIGTAEEQNLEALFAGGQEPYPYHNTISIVASTENEAATDLDNAYVNQTLDGKAHGLLTDMMLRVLYHPENADENKDGQTSYGELRAFLTKQIVSYDIGGRKQSPQVYPTLKEDVTDVLNKPLFGTSRAIVRADHQPTQSVIAVQRLKIFLDSPQQDIQQRLAHLPIEWMAANSLTDLIVEQGSRSGLWTLSNGSHEPITENATISTVIERIKAEQWLRQLQNDLKKSSNTLNVQTTPTHKANAFDQNDKVQLQIKSKDSSYLIIFTINSDGQVHLLYPVNSQENQRMNAQQLQAFPQTPLLIQAPYGQDVIVTAAVSQAIDLAKIENLVKDYVNLSHTEVSYLQHFLTQQSNTTINVLPVRTYEKFNAAGE